MPQIGSVWAATKGIFAFSEKVLSAPAAEAPKFEEIVKVVIATFAVFTGVALKDYVVSTKLEPEHWYAFVVLVALLLRYIIGSGVHLTYTYARKDATAAEPNSASVVLLVKDFGFIVFFGFVAVQMASATDFPTFWYFAKCFLAAGFIWSVTDCILRYCWCRVAGNDNEWPKRQFWLVWAVLDAVQFGLTWLIPELCPTRDGQAAALAAIYAFFLLVDIKAIVRIVQVQLDP